MVGRGPRQFRLDFIELHVGFTLKVVQEMLRSRKRVPPNKRIQLQNTKPAVAHQFMEYQAIWQMVSSAFIAQSRIISKSKQSRNRSIILYGTDQIFDLQAPALGTS